MSYKTSEEKSKEPRDLSPAGVLNIIKDKAVLRVVILLIFIAFALGAFLEFIFASLLELPSYAGLGNPVSMIISSILSLLIVGIICGYRYRRQHLIGFAFLFAIISRIPAISLKTAVMLSSMPAIDWGAIAVQTKKLQEAFR